VSAQEPQATGYVGGSALLFFLGSFGSKEEPSDVSVSKSVEGELAAADGFQKFAIFRGPRVQGPKAFSVPDERLAEFPCGLAQRDGLGYRA